MAVFLLKEDDLIVRYGNVSCQAGDDVNPVFGFTAAGHRDGSEKQVLLEGDVAVHPHDAVEQVKKYLGLLFVHLS